MRLRINRSHLPCCRRTPGLSPRRGSGPPARSDKIACSGRLAGKQGHRDQRAPRPPARPGPEDCSATKGVARSALRRVIPSATFGCRAAADAGNRRRRVHVRRRRPPTPRRAPRGRRRRLARVSHGRGALASSLEAEEGSRLARRRSWLEVSASSSPTPGVVRFAARRQRRRRGDLSGGRTGVTDATGTEWSSTPVPGRSVRESGASIRSSRCG